MNQNQELADLIANSNLIGFQTQELYARLTGEEIPEDYSTKLDLTPQFMLVEDTFGVRIQATATTSFGEAGATIAATYSLSEGYATSVETVDMFMEEVGVFVLAPFIREALHEITARVFGNPVVLPMIDRNSFTTGELS